LAKFRQWRNTLCIALGSAVQMPIRLEALLGTCAETWVAMQADYDRWRAKQKRHPRQLWDRALA
jgi:plasmid maintenance system antidote protein VapI